ncbi:MAG TPA: Hsp70 family protein [Acidimicrobiales bacterium]|nr:Hsp70 family protein [Acidimicrobiales bacterium]
MGYYLGVDIGTTYTAAAVWRDGRCDIAGLGNRAPTIPSVVFLRDDGTVLVGEAAARRAASEPAGVAREFKRRVGDPTPVIVGGTPYSADALMARLLRAVVDLVVEAEGARPDRIAVTHPANWGPYKLDLLRQATRLADLDDVVTVSEPEAAAIHYASQSRVEPGSVIAVYDLGGGTFDAAVLRKTAAGWDVLGTPEGIERLGGVDFDAAVHHHVATAIGPAFDELSPDDPAAVAAAARLRQECVDAKEALSADSDVSIPVLLPKLQTEVRLTRSEYEQMVRPALADTITSLTRALRSADVEPGDVTTVLLVGGASRTPLVAELVSSALGRPVAVDAHPKYGVALGAAITAAVAGGRTGAGDNTSVTTPPGEVAPDPAVAAAPSAPTAARPRDSAVPAAPLVAGTTAAATAGAASAAARPSAEPRPAGGPTRAQPATPAAAGAPTTSARAQPARPQAGDGTTRPGAAGSPTVGSGGRQRDPRSIMVPYGMDRLPPASGGPRHVAGDDDDAPPRIGGRDASRRAVLVLSGVLAVVAMAVAAILVLRGGDDDPGGEDAATAAETTDSAGEATATTEPPTPTGPFVQINSVELEDGQFQVNYQVLGYVPDVETEGSLHIHFFPNTTEHDNAGNNGTPPGEWNLTDEPQSFLTDYTPQNTPGATQMCAAVADFEHNVHQREGDPTGNCVDLPD